MAWRDDAYAEALEAEQERALDGMREGDRPWHPQLRPRGMGPAPHLNIQSCRSCRSYRDKGMCGCHGGFTDPWELCDQYLPRS